MFVVRTESDGIREFSAFRRLRDARFHASRRIDREDGAVEIFEVRDTDDAELAVLAVRDGRAKPVGEFEPDQAVILASMGLGTGLRI